MKPKLILNIMFGLVMVVLSASCYSENYENGTTVPDWNMVKRIESVYDFPADYIFFSKKYAESGINNAESE